MEVWYNKMDAHIEFTQITLSNHQADFLAWCNKHYHQLIELRNSNCLNIPGSNFTVHLKDSINLDVPPIIEVIDLNGKYRPTKHLSTT